MIYEYLRTILYSRNDHTIGIFKYNFYVGSNRSYTLLHKRPMMYFQSNISLKTDLL